MDDAGRVYAGAMGYRSLTQALGAATHDGVGFRRREPQFEPPRSPQLVLDRIAMLARCFEQLGPAATPGPDQPPWKEWRKPFFSQRARGARSLGCLPTPLAAGLAPGARPAASDPSLACWPHGASPVELPRFLARAPQRPARPFRVFMAAFAATLAVLTMAAPFVPPSGPHPEWGVKNLAELTFAGAGMSLPASIRAEGDRLDPTTGPRSTAVAAAPLRISR